MTTATQALTKLEDFTPYSDAVNKLASLQEQLRDVESAIASKHPQTVQSLEDQVGELLATGKLQENPTISRTSELERLSNSREVLRAAIAKQQTEVSTQKSEASRLICEGLKPRYTSVMRECSQAVIQLGQAFEKQRRFHATIPEDVAFSAALPSLPLRDSADTRDQCSSIAYWLIEGLELGFVRRSDVPTEWLIAWGKN